MSHLTLIDWSGQESVEAPGFYYGFFRSTVSLNSADPSCSFRAFLGSAIDSSSLSDGSLWGEEIFLLARVFFTLVLLNLRIALPTKYQIVPSFCIQVWIWRSVCRLYIIHMHLEITCYVYGMVNLSWLYAEGYTRFLIKLVMYSMWIMNIINFFKLSSMINTMFTS